jgi:hypothetical protein
MKSQVLLHYLEFSRHNFCVAIGDTFKLAAAAACKQRYVMPVLPIGDAIACATVDDAGGVILLLWDHLTIPTIVHEVTHVTNAILLKMGVKLCDESDEAFAHHNGMLMELVMRWLQKIAVEPDPY